MQNIRNKNEKSPNTAYPSVRLIVARRICNRIGYNMRHFSTLLLLLTFFYACVSKKSDKGVFVWWTEVREYRGTFDTTKYSNEQIEGVYKLCLGHFGSFDKTGISDREGVIDLTEIREKSEEKILKNFIAEKNELESLQIIESDFWKERKRKKLEELTDKYELQLITIKAYSDPQVLKDNRFSDLCHLYVDIANLKDTTELLDYWKDLFDKKYYGDIHIRHFIDQSKTLSERFSNARADVITFGYWHCTSRKLAELDKENGTAEEFEKLFTDIKSERTY